MMTSLRFGLVLTTVWATVPCLAYAHAELLWPPPRNGSECDGGGGDNCKTGPCGAGVGTPGTPLTLTQGSSITIQWQETISHNGDYELRLSTNGAVDAAATQRFTSWVLNENIPDTANGEGTILNPAVQYTYTMTVPTSQNCNPCVLQFIQFMSATNDYYYMCADVAILPAGAATPTPTATPGPTSTPTPNPIDEMETVHGGCVCSTTASSAASGWFVLAGFALVGLLGFRRVSR